MSLNVVSDRPSDADGGSDAAANPGRKTYKVGDRDQQDRVIDCIFSRFADYVTYETEETMQIEGCTDKLDGCPELNRLINRSIALSNHKEARKRRRFYYQVATAIDQCMAGHPEDAVKTMQAIIDNLTRRANSSARLCYLASTAIATSAIWIGAGLIAWLFSGWSHWFWVLTMAVGATGALFSVIINQRKIPLDFEDSKLVHFTAGASRAVVGMIAGAICYLAMKSDIALVFVLKLPVPEGVVFFCLLSGFSETLVPNLLQKQEEVARKGRPTAG